MQKTKRNLMALGAATLLFALPAFAADYGGYSTAELAAMRGSMRNATVEEQNAYRQEWQNRVRSMNQEERQLYGVGQGQSLRLRDGSCVGSGSRSGRGGRR